MPNRLATETSPYLRQHADNPVDWYSWGAEAFVEARRRDVPILLSVGYSSCHWCHVMAHESFEDDEIAAVMNGAFVNVKVDREERPDVDAIYMEAVQALTGRGGWPMTVFLTPDGRPFYGGTYFPPTDRPGAPGFVRVMEVVAGAWANKRVQVTEQADKLREVIEGNTLHGQVGAGSDGPLLAEVLEHAYASLRERFDARFGGFGGAPKFPPAMALDFLLSAYVRGGSPETLEMITTTLDAMAAGGIYDHVGGGFARYATDAFWLVPHFEKMLYDQALLVGAYLRGYLVTGELRYRRTVEETVGYVLRDLRHHDGGFFSAEDADAEGVEGKFYLWSLDEIREVCGADADEVIAFFGVTEGGSFTEPHTGYTGNILHAVDREADRPDAVSRALSALLARRSTRVRPGLDDKVLLAWNALFAKSLAEAAAALERDDWMADAVTNVRFCLAELRQANGRFLRSWQAEGGARHLAYAQDYAALLEVLCTLAEVDDVSWLVDARAVADEMLRLFHDPASGGFFTTGSDAEPLIVRPQDFFDNATPSENSLAANALLRLAALTGETAYETSPRAVLGLLAPVIAKHAHGFAYLLAAYERAIAAPVEVAIVGHSPALRREVYGRLLPASVTVADAAGTGADLTPLLAGRGIVDGMPAAYVCERYACRHPVTTPEALREELDGALARRG
ncbi:MAG: thioredoxin domain-containing protein [Actinobacteria bacterium]|nr:thioredoxin domain-containing protein [Actinomycetota bacterium]